MRTFTVIPAICLLLLSFPAYPGEREAFISEEFDSLADWAPVYFRGIDRHSEYSIEKNGDMSCLVAASNSSASGLAHGKTFNVYRYPKVRWRWMIRNVYEKGDAASRAGDDYPVRVYIMFSYDPARASFAEKLKYGLARAFYGQYPPSASLNYIWANREHETRVLTSTYSERSRMVVLQSGGERGGQWVEEDVDILDDFRRAFGGEPPPEARLAVMNDSDNTGESSVSFIDYIEVYRESPGQKDPRSGSPEGKHGEKDPAPRP